MAKKTEHTMLSNDQANFAINHLTLESQYLDSVIETSLEMQLILRERPATAATVNGNATNTALQLERNQRLKVRLSKLREKIAEQFLPVLEGRKQLVEFLKSVDPDQTKTPSVSALAMKVEEPHRSELKRLRCEIRGKLNQVQSISMGSQALLIYTLDFYSKLLTGISQDIRQPKYYNSLGRSQKQLAGSLLKTNC